MSTLAEEVLRERLWYAPWRIRELVYIGTGTCWYEKETGRMASTNVCCALHAREVLREVLAMEKDGDQ